MIKSMTGYGSAQGTSGQIEISIELRSVNNRFLDCNIRMPRVYTAFEDAMKSLVQKYISRGKVDIFVTIDSGKADDFTISINEALADAYMDAFKKLADRYGIENDVTTLALSRQQDVLKIEKNEADADKLCADICAVLENALIGFNSMRTVEGEKLYNDILSRVTEIERLTAMAEERSPKTVSEYRARLEQKMKEVLENTEIEESRILTEAAIFADRVAINEETVRLRSHIAQLRDILNSSEPVGRKIDFLVQEFNREANTIGSKGNDTQMSRVVVDLKAEIEKIREQIQNIE